VHAVEGVPLLGCPKSAEPFARALKRAIDAVVAAVALTVLSPVFVYIAARIRLDSEGPVFFRQTRLSANMKFTALKFRTMRVDTTSPCTERPFVAPASASSVPSRKERCTS